MRNVENIEDYFCPLRLLCKILAAYITSLDVLITAPANPDNFVSMLCSSFHVLSFF